jgi:pimeloyl-[acyl-carrier protein] methyl ester esterase
MHQALPAQGWITGISRRCPSKAFPCRRRTGKTHAVQPVSIEQSPMSHGGRFRFVLVHGWGFDRSVWRALRPTLGAPVAMSDPGCFAPDQLGVESDGRPVIAIGHSLGFASLLRQPPPDLAGMVAINGFACFTARPDLPEGTPRRVVERMIARFDQTPAAVLDEFRRRCGATEPYPGEPDLPRLRMGLADLRDRDERPALRALPVPILALAGEADPIVPATLTRATFDPVPHARLVWQERGGHLLPLTAPAWCVREILSFAGDLA